MRRPLTSRRGLGPRVELTAKTLNYIHVSEFEAPAVFAYSLPPKSMRCIFHVTFRVESNQRRRGFAIRYRYVSWLLLRLA